LKELFGRKTHELEQQSLNLRTQLKTVRAELTQANSWLRTLKGVDGHGTHTHTHKILFCLFVLINYF